MARLTFTKDNLPTPDEFRRLLLEAAIAGNPVDALLELAGELREYEEQYGLASEVFYEKYQRGEMGDEREIMHWAMLYSAFVEHKSRIEASLMREAVQRGAEAVPA
jgi:hypothetical protein